MRLKRKGRWAAYEEGALEVHQSRGVHALAIGLDGKVYSGSDDKTITAWSGESGTHLQTLSGHAHAVTALAVGLNGNI